MVALAGQTIAADKGCTQPDASFEAFLARFKASPQFRESRLVLPLRYVMTDPDGTSETYLTLEQIHAQKLALIINNAQATSLKGTEGELCEDPPQVKGDKATLAQSSCDTDAYSDLFQFTRRSGCWYLKSLHISGG
jgi:hypothetical protein